MFVMRTEPLPMPVTPPSDTFGENAMPDGVNVYTVLRPIGAVTLLPRLMLLLKLVRLIVAFVPLVGVMLMKSAVDAARPIDADVDNERCPQFVRHVGMAPCA